MISKGLRFTDVSSKVMAKFWQRVNVGHKGKCWPWTGTVRDKNGYGQIGCRGRYPLAHVVAFVLTKHDVDPGMCVLHRCDNPKCCNPDHLFYGTISENNSDRSQKGRNGDHAGERNGRSILTERDVIMIREMAKDTKFGALATRFGVKTVTIAKTVQRKSWKHIP